jgi:uncharacterized protein
MRAHPIARPCARWARCPIKSLVSRNIAPTLRLCGSKIYKREANTMQVINVIALILVIVGGLNWGLVGLLDFDLVAALFGVDTWLTNLVYILVGIAALYCIVLLKPVMNYRATPAHHTR